MRFRLPTPPSPALRAALLCWALAACATSCDRGEGADEAAPGGPVAKPPPQQAILLRTESSESRPPGTKIQNSVTLTTTNAKLIHRTPTDTQSGSLTSRLRDVWVVETVSDVERSFELTSATSSQEIRLGGAPRIESVDSTIDGIEFTVTRPAPDSDSWVVDLEGHNLSALQQLELESLGELWSEQSHALYPEEPLAIGHRWKPDPRVFGPVFSPRLEVREGEINCELVDTTVLRGQRCASVAIDIDVSGTFRGGAASAMEVQIALRGTITRSIQHYFDLRTELKGTMQWEMPLEGGSSISIDGVAEFIKIAKLKQPDDLGDFDETE